MYRLAWSSLTLCCVVWGLGCSALEVEPPRFEDDSGQVPDEDAGFTGPDVEVPPLDAPPTVRITAPKAGDAIPLGTLRIEGTSGDDRGVASVFVKVGPNVPKLAETQDNFRTWWIESPVPQGVVLIEAEARDTAGQRSNPDRVSVTSETLGADTESPTVTILSPPDGSTPLHALVLVQGTAQDDRAVVSMDVLRNGELLKERAVATDDFFATWSRLVPLLPGLENELTFIARDALGNEGRATITLTGRAEVDRDAPSLEVTSPQDQAVINASSLEVRGTASDAVGMREVKVRVGTKPDGASEVVWEDYVTATTEDGFATWQATLAVPSGPFVLEARAIDLNGLATSVTLNLSNLYVSEWTEEVAIPLRLRAPTAAPTLRFELDRNGVNEVIAADVQRDIRVLELDTTNLLTDALNQIKTSCGTLWQQDDPNPRHDCTLTELGRTFARDGRTWQQSPEYAFVRLLTMTPANVVVTGTSIENLQGLANRLNVGGGFRQILAETLGISRTNEIVSTAAVVKALQEKWIASHPAASPGAKLAITLYDAMRDLAPLPERFGPSGSHPGLLDPSFTPRSEVFGPNFKMLLVARSNLRWLDGVDLSGAGNRPQKDYMAVVVDTTGPTFDDVLEFDFNDSTRFDVTGLNSNPRVDLRMRVLENDAFVPSCVEGSNCKANMPNTPYGGNKYVWSKAKYELEHLLAAAAYNQYATRNNYRQRYTILFGVIEAAEVTVGYGSGNPAGWTTFDTFADLGDPPPPQFLWELILEVGQVALHRVGNTTFPEGQADVMFTLRNVNVGLTADQIRTAMRPELQAQRATLSKKLLGDYAKNNGALDFFYQRGADGKPYLFFAAESDPRPQAGYKYAAPGFFADPELTQKLSSKAAGTSGDSVHEKLSLSAGETTVYVKDEAGQTYRLRLVVGDDPTEISVFASRRIP